MNSQSTEDLINRVARKGEQRDLRKVFEVRWRFDHGWTCDNVSVPSIMKIRVIMSYTNAESGLGTIRTCSCP